MEADKSLVSGSMALLVLKLLEDGDKYGYQMTSELRQRSEDVFHLKAGTLYPLLHSLEEKGLVTAYEREAAAGKPRRYYHLTKAGEAALREKEAAPVEGAAEIEALIAKRLEAKRAKNWAEADAIRDQLRAMGVEIKDGKDGTTWTRI